MIVHSLRVAVLLAFVSVTVGCALLQPPPADKKGAREVRRPAQTGTYISRTERESAKAEKAEKKAKTTAAKATPTPKPKRERPKPPGKVDDDFVTRGGFR